MKANDLVHLYQIGRHSEIPDLSIAHMQIIAVAHVTACKTWHVQEAVDVFYNQLMICKSKQPIVCQV